MKQSQIPSSIDRISIATATFVIITIVCTATAIFWQLQQKRQQTICRNYLRHQATAFHLYSLENQGEYPIHEKWRDAIAEYLQSKDCSRCPSVFPTENFYSYKLNSQININQSQMVLLFDGEYNKKSISSDTPYREIDNRHLGGANLLKLDGSVWYCHAISEGVASEKIGWDIPGNYQWRP